MFGKDMVFSEGGANTWMGVLVTDLGEATVALCDITKGIFLASRSEFSHF